MACEPTKCCGPPTPGLLAWAYIKLVLILGLTGWYLYLCVEEFQYAIYGENQDSLFLSATKMILIMLPVGACLLHLVFTTIFTIGVHHENYDALRVYLAYFIVEFAVASGWTAYTLYTGIVDNYYIRNSFWWCMIFPDVLNILWTLYFIVFFGSDLQLLKKTGEETVLPRPVIQEQDRRSNVYWNATPPTSDRRKPLFPVEELEMLRQQMGVTDV